MLCRHRNEFFYFGKCLLERVELPIPYKYFFYVLKVWFPFKCCYRGFFESWDRHQLDERLTLFCRLSSIDQLLLC